MAHGALPLEEPCRLEARALLLAAQVRGQLARAGCGISGHYPAEPNVSDRVEKLLDGWRGKMRADAWICREHGGKRAILEEGRLGGVIDDVVSVLATEDRAQFQHDGLRHDQTAAQIQVAPHAYRIELQPAHDFAEPG